MDPKYYHVLKTHKIPTEVNDPSTWLENNGFPIRGIYLAEGGQPNDWLDLWTTFYKME